MRTAFTIVLEVDHDPGHENDVADAINEVLDEGVPQNRINALMEGQEGDAVVDSALLLSMETVVRKMDAADVWVSEDGLWEGTDLDEPGVLSMDKIHLLDGETLFGIGFHVEAYRVVLDGEGLQECASDFFRDDFDALYGVFMPDGAFQTIEVDGNEYVPFLLPHSA